MGAKKDSIINSFRKAVMKHISPCQIVLFGSRAKGKARADSDYDFLLVSPHFKKWNWELRLAKAYGWKRNIPAAMDILCYTPEEFEQKKKQIGIVQQAVKEGVEILSR